MPIEALLPLVQQKADGIKNTLSQILTTADNRRYSKKIYNQQKRDNVEFWNMQNAYNSPEAQMGRFKAAGLNPNLIYGQQNTGGAPQTPDFKNVPGVAPRFQSGDSLNNINSFYDIELKKQMINNTKAQYDVIKNEDGIKKSRAQNECNLQAQVSLKKAKL